MKRSRDLAVVRYKCSACGEKLLSKAKHAGKSTRCPSCSAEIRVPEAPPEPKPEPLGPVERVTVACRLCGTRVDVPGTKIGKKLKCPDCGALTEIRAPEPKPGPVRPAAMDGWQYELYEGDDQPWAADLIAAQPEYIPVECRVCQTVMHAPPSILGKLLECPDCGAKTRVERPAEEPTALIDTSPGADYELETQTELPREEPPRPAQEASARPPAGFRELAEAKQRLSTGRPKPPRFAMFVGVLRMWRSSAMVGVTLGLMTGLLVVAVIGGAIFGLLSAGGMAAAVGVVFMAIPIVMGAMLVGVVSHLLIELLVESSEGNDRISNWPQSELQEWTAASFYLIVAVAMSAIPGSALAALLPPDSSAAAILTSIWLLLPVVLLSQLEQSAALSVLSPGVIRTLWHAPVAWFTIYLQSGLMLAAVIALGVLLQPHLGEFLLVPLAVIATPLLMLYARLLGRLSWVASDATPAPVSEEE